ncbi:hypothetical protein FISHEDRAFT_52075 [Fistulina hepatica ATCC 64428]|nr:hypothetical protein FISHEDRAFT_52075 [Fistulina hepatica ATCC 64428]
MVMGLQHARQMAVGDARICGASRGKKKHVSICEVLAARANIACWDNATRGLDASTALGFIQALCIATDLTCMTSIVTLYQASESLYHLFDKASTSVCVINQGCMAYFGPAAEACNYFIDLGYKPANQQTTSDFLVSVMDPVSRCIFADYPVTAMPPPRTPAEFAQHFLESPATQVNRADMEAYRVRSIGKSSSAEAYHSSACDEHADHTRKASPYLISVPMQMHAVVLLTLWDTSSFTYQGIIIDMVFFQCPDNTGHYFSCTGTLFFTLMFAAIVTMAEISALFTQWPQKIPP